MSPAPRTLQAVVGAVRAHLARRVGVAVGLWWVAAAAWVLVAAWLLAGPDGWRQGTRGPVLLDALLLATVGGAVVVFRRGIRRWFDERRLSDAMERAVGLRPGIVRGSLELTRGVPPGVSRALAERAAEDTVGELDRPVGELSGSLGRAVSGWTHRGSGAAALMAVMLTLLALAAPSRTGKAWSGLSRPFSLAATPRLAAVVVTPGDVEVPRGSDVDVRVVAPGRGSVQLVWQAAGDIAHDETVVVQGGVGVRRYGAVSATIEYLVRTPDGVTTRRYRITPVDPLFVSDLQVDVTYPPHTGLPPDEFHGTVPPLRLPEGTRLDVSGRTSRPLSEAGLADAAGTTVLALRVDGTSFEGRWRPTVAGRFGWSFRDARGGPAALQPDSLDIDLLPDSAPVVAIPLPGSDTVMPLGQRQPLIVEARDDYGLSRLEVVAYRVTAAGERQAPYTMGLDMAGTRAAMARPLLNMSEWGLLPGDQVRYFARAMDNAPRPQATQSREYVLRVPDASEIRRRAQEELDSMAAAVQQMAQEADQQAEANRNRELKSAADEQARREAQELSGRQAGAKQDTDAQQDFEQHEELKKALDEQKALSGRADSMQAELQQLKKSMEDAGQADPQLTRDLEELQKLMQQVSGDDLEKQLDQLSRSLDQGDTKQANRSLEDLAAQQEKFRDRLEESLERFRRAAAQQEFRATREDAEELARQERALASALEDAGKADDARKRAAQQKELEGRTEELGQHMEQLQQRLDQLDEPDASEAVKQAQSKAAEAQTTMARAGEHAQGQRSRQASEQAQEAAEKLEDAAKQLDDAQKKMTEQGTDTAQKALSQAADDALALARRQVRLRDQMGTASEEGLDEMRGDEEALLQGTRNLAQNLMEGTQGAIAGSRDFSEQIGRAMQSLQGALDAMQARRDPASVLVASADRATAALNQLALLALAGSEQMSQQQGQSGQGSQDTQQQVQQLAQQQGELVNKTGQLTPMQLGEQALKEQLKKLAEEQQRLADELSDAAEKPDAEDRTLGDLDALAKEASALAQQMAQGRLTPDMMKRQERLFHRLLDAGRSLENDDEISDERESKTAGAFQHNVVEPLSADQLGALRYGLPDAAQLQRLPPAVRQLVIQYFERLNRGGGGAGDAAPPKHGGGGR